MDGPDGHATEGLELLDVGVAIFDRKTRLVFANTAFRKLRRYPKKVCRKGVTLTDLLRYSADRGDFGPGKPTRLVAERLAEIEQAERREIEREMADGQILGITYRRMPSGGIVVTFTDRTAERRAEAALKASEERYALVSEAAEEAIYEWDIAGKRFYASPRLAALIGRDWGESGERPWDWSEIVHPDDLGHYRKALKKHLSGAAQRWRCEYRLKDASGDWRWVSDHGTSIRDRKGRAVRMVAAIRDITERVQKDAALAASEERHALVSRATSDGIYDWNVTEDLLYVSDNLIRILDFDLGIKASGMWAERVHPEDLDRYVAAIREHFRGETEALECEYRVRGAGGDYRWIQDRGIGVRDSDDRVSRMVGAVRDITEMKAAQAELDHTEALLASSLATISDGILMVDGEHRVQLWNDRYAEIWADAAGGADVSSIIVRGRPFRDMIREGYVLGMFKPHPDGVDAWVAARMEAWEKPASQWELELANGAWILLNEREMPDGGRVSVYTDITELKRREGEAQAERQRFEEAIEAIASGFALWDAEDRLVVFNSRYKEYFEGFADMVVPGVRFRDLIRTGIERGMFAADDPDAELNRIIEKRAAISGEPRERHLASGLWLQITDHRTADGGVVSIYTDVTELKNREEEIRRQSAILEQTLQNMGQGITMVDKDLKVVAYNRKFLELMDWPEDRFGVGFRMEDAFRFNAERGEYGPGDVEEQVRERVELSKKFLPHQFERTRPDGMVLEIIGNPIDGGGLVATYTDITERKRAEEALKSALDEFNTVIENIAYGVLFTGPDERARICNRAFREMWGVPQEFIDQRPTMREMIEYNRETGLYGIAPEDWDNWIDGRLAQIAAGDIPPVEFHRADGMVLTYQCVALPDGGRMLTYFDISELKKAEQVVRDSEARLRGILENSPIGVAVIGDDNIIRFHNARFPEILGGPGQNLVGTESNRFWTDLEERERSMEVFRKEGRVREREVMYRGLDGSDVWSQSTYERAEWDGVSARLVWIYDITAEKANREALLVARDAAQMALADLQKAQQRLIQAEKMASLGQLTAGIAHEIKNPLNFVNNFAKLSDEMLKELTEILAAPIQALDAETRDDAEDLLTTVRENLGKINQHGKRADSIVKNMLLHSREGPSQAQTVGLNAIADEALNLAYHGARAEHPDYNIDMQKALAPEVGEIECFPQDLMRVFLNLISNGIYAANKKRAAAPECFAPTVALTTKSVGDRVEVEVRDNGTGIPPEAREKIFNPFFTTKPAGEGTGLGLSLSYDIVVKQHGGELTVESEPGEFTAFRVMLPRTLPASGGARP